VETALSYHVISETFCLFRVVLSLKPARTPAFAVLPHISMEFQDSKQA